MRGLQILFTTLCIWRVSPNSIKNGSYSEGFETQNDTRIEYVPLNSEDHPCARTCLKGASPMECHYKFVVEWYQTMSKACYSCPEVLDDCYRPDCVIGDGRARTIMTINRRMPGPMIEVCLGDRVIVDVENLLMGETTTIHWHGMHQKGTPYMDGVPFVTQCPIQPGINYVYNFTASNAGTHFWHSHTGMQRGDGAFGNFIVRVPQEDDPHSHLYDFDLKEHVISLLDWDADLNLNMFVSHYHSSGDNKPATLLVNGLGLRNFENETQNTPIARFFVTPGFRHRFRLINAGFLNCPVEMSIDNHTLTVISSDGNDFEAVEAESLVSYAGERFDFIISADQPEDIYWIRFRGLMDCDERFTKAHQVAILQYDGTSELKFPDVPIPDYENSHKEGLQINPLNEGTESKDKVIIPHLKALVPWDETLKELPDQKFFIYYDFYKIDNPHYHRHPHYGFYNLTDGKQQVLTPQLNRISFRPPPTPLLLGKDYLSDEKFCNETTLKASGRNCSAEFCQCTHVLQAKLNSIVEIILVDTGFAYDANHPFHLHGHSFRVVGMERLGKNVTVEKVKELDSKGLLKRNLKSAPIKDTVTVPDGGYTIIRLNASNPGYWIFHCHIEFHVEVGMALVFKIGEDSDMPPPPQDIPVCGPYMPLVKILETKSAASTVTGSLFVILAASYIAGKLKA